MITLRQLGPDGLKTQLAELDRAELGGSVGRTGKGVPHLAGSTAPHIGVPRKVDAAQRWLIDHEAHAQMIVDEIWRVYDTEEGARSVSKFVTVERNLLRRIINDLAVVYERPPVRQIGSDIKLGSARSEAMAKAWRRVVLEEGKFDLHAQQWARYAMLLNVVHVIPQVFEGRLIYETIYPYSADVVMAPGENEPSVLVYASNGAGWCFVAVDAERFWYLDEDMVPVFEFEHGYKDLRGRPMQPWVAWRVLPRLASEPYWGYPIGRQLVDATLAVGRASAAMEEVRKNNAGKLSTLTAPSIKDDVPPNQAVTPEYPLMLRDGKFEVHDLSVPVTEFLEHIASHEASLAEAYRVPVGVLNSARTVDSFSEHAAIAKQRDDQIKFLRMADVETSIKTAIVMRADSHPDTGELDPQAVSDTFAVKYQALTFLERPADRFAAYNAEMGLGLASPVDLRQREHPDEDRATAHARQLETLLERNEFNSLQARHQLATDPSEDGENLAQQQGRVGGQATSDEDDDDE